MEESKFLIRWNEDCEAYDRLEAAHEEAKALVFELLGVAVWAKDRAMGEAAIDIQGTITKATKWLEGK